MPRARPGFAWTVTPQHVPASNWYLEQVIVSVATAEFIVNIATGYVACGAAFALVFVWRWVGNVDAAAIHGTTGFRILIIPGVSMLWPLFVVRLLRGVGGPPDEWTAHRAAVRREQRRRAMESYT